MTADADSSESMFGDSDQGACCKSIGRMGFVPENSRWTITILCAVMVTVSAILSCIAAIGLSLDGTNEYPWVTATQNKISRGVHSHVEFYGALSGKDYSWKNTNVTSGKVLRNVRVVESWDPSPFGCSQASCGPCHAASIAGATLVILSIVFSMPALIMICRRASETSDGHGEKFVTLIGTFCAFLSCFLAVLIYWFHCVDQLPKKMEVEVVDFNQTWQIRMDYGPGIGLYCVILATIFQFLASLCNCMVPTPLGPDEEPLLGNDLESPDEMAKLKQAQKDSSDANAIADAAAKAAEQAEAEADLERPNSSYEDTFISTAKNIPAGNPKLYETKDAKAPSPRSAERTNSEKPPMPKKPDPTLEAQVLASVAAANAVQQNLDAKQDELNQTRDSLAEKSKAAADEKKEDASMAAIKASAARRDERHRRNDENMSQQSWMSTATQQSGML